jgi:hypothetical protein
MSRVNNTPEKTGTAWKKVQFPAFVTVTIVFLLLFGYNSMFRVLNFADPDTMNFVNIAKNITAGRGIVQSTLGFNQPFFAYTDQSPIPLTVQPPLYPLLTALVALTGIPVDLAGLTVSLVAFAVVLFLIYAISRRQFGTPAAYLCVFLAVLYEPLHNFPATAFSEITGLMFLLLVFHLITTANEKSGKTALPLLFAAGLAAGLAFATRYVLILSGVVGVVYMVKERRWQSGRLVSFLLGGALPVVPVLVRNVILLGSPMPRLKPSTEGIAAVLWDLVKAIGGTFAPDSLVSQRLQMILAFAAVAVLAFVLFKKFGKSSLNEVFIAKGRYLYWLWIAVYLAGLFVQRAMSHFDTIDARFILMATVPLVILLAGFAAGLLEKHPKIVTALAGVLVLAAFGREIATSVSLPYASQATAIQNSANLTWIRENTTRRDLVIGDNTVYVPFYFDYPEAVSYSPYPYTEYFTEKELKDATASRCSKYEHIYLIMRIGETDSEEKWNAKYGGFLTSLVFHREAENPSVQFVKDTGESMVFAVKCP